MQQLSGTIGNFSSPFETSPFLASSFMRRHFAQEKTTVFFRKQRQIHGFSGIESVLNPVGLSRTQLESSVTFYVSVTKTAHRVVLNFKLILNTDYLAHFHFFIANICSNLI